jgi:hypothetical protein
MFNATDFNKREIRYYRLNAHTVGVAVEIIAVYRAKNRIKVRYIGDRKPFMIDLDILHAHGGDVEE